MKIARSIASLLVAASAATVALPASAQWIWKDEGGHTVASDQPPPVGTPASRIVRSPRARPAFDAGAPAAPADGNEPQAKSLADRELEFKQHQKEVAEAAKKNDEEAAQARALKENCAAVRGNLAGLQEGGRAARVNERGEKTYLTDAQRAAEINRAQGQIAQYCR